MTQNLQQNQEPTKGFVFVASKRPAFYYSAINCIESIRDYYPDAKFALFTEKRFMDHRCDDIDYVFECGTHIREKLYGMANSPFDITFYVDADTICEHEDIVGIWDQLKDNDMVFVRLEKDPVSSKSFVEVEGDIPSINETIDLTLCGGVCLYDNRNPLVKEFMQEWWDKFQVQEDAWNDVPNTKIWWPHDTPKTMLRWDQFTLWWMINKEEKYKDLKIGRFDDNYRWNWFTSFKFDDNGKHRLVSKHPIIVHHSSSMRKHVEY